MAYNSYRATDYLSHHGIKGQKWGVRRFQNEDGSVTPAGAQRYYSQYGDRYKRSDDPKNVPNNSSNVDKSNSSSSGKNQNAKVGDYGVAAETVAAIAYVSLMVAMPLASKGAQALKNYNLNKKYVNRLNEERKGEEFDESVGLHKQSSPGTRESNMAAVNPDFKGYDRKTMSEGTVQNCLLCTTAYEMRNRGYDCSAKKSVQPRNGLQFTDQVFKNVKNNVVDGSPDLKNSADLYRSMMKCAQPGGNKELARNTVSKMSKEPDSRGQILVVWGAGGGHSMAYEVKGGKVSILDCQQNKVFEGQDLENLISKTCHVQYQRLDNLEINEKGIRRYCA